jgi:hypothetical protein
MDIRVEYGGEDGGEREPAVVWFGKRRLGVRAVIDRWYGSDRGWWKLDTEDGPYVLQRDDASGKWELAAVPRTQVPNDPGSLLPPGRTRH